MVIPTIMLKVLSHVRSLLVSRTTPANRYPALNSTPVSTYAEIMDAEIKSYFPTADAYFGYFDPWHPSTFYKALEDLEAFIVTEGPFDGVLAYSHGAQRAASIMIRMHRETPSRQPFKCAIFLSGGTRNRVIVPDA